MGNKKRREEKNGRKGKENNDPIPDILQICLCPMSMLELGTVAYAALIIGTSRGF